MNRITGPVLSVLLCFAVAHTAEGNEQSAAIEYSTCVAACEQGQSQAKCAAYCQCTTARSQSEFTRQESRQMAKAMLYGGEIKPATADKFRNIILECATQNLM